ncbi:MAG: ROK family protein [Ilumatobacteraceae bacterium]
MPTFLAIDVANDRLTAGIVDAKGEVAVRDRVATPLRDVWPAVHRLVHRVLAAKPDDVESPIACGVSCEGPMDLQAGTVTPLHLPIWENFELRERARDLSGLPTTLATSGVARVVAERWVGAAQHSANVMAVLVSDGVEAGIISNGRLLRGGHGNLGQIGHVIVEPDDGAPCPCGSLGCLAAYASSSAIERETDRPLRRTPNALVERTGALIGRAVASAVAVFDLRLVVLAGAVPHALGAPLVDAARRELEARSKLTHLRTGSDKLRYKVQLVQSRLGTEAPLVGAAGLARWELARTAPVA